MEPHLIWIFRPNMLQNSLGALDDPLWLRWELIKFQTITFLFSLDWEKLHSYNVNKSTGAKCHNFHESHNIETIYFEYTACVGILWLSNLLLWPKWIMGFFEWLLGIFLCGKLIKNKEKMQKGKTFEICKPLTSLFPIIPILFLKPWL